MPRRPPYWIDERPSDAKRWAGMTLGTVLDRDTYAERIFHLYRRYVKQWNDIELDNSRSLSEHTHNVAGATVSGSQNKFILSAGTTRDDRWLLEVKFGRGFRQFYPGLSTGRNAMRTVNDVGQILLHWAGDGNNDFQRWLAAEEQTTDARGEWAEYRA